MGNFCPIFHVISDLIGFFQVFYVSDSFHFKFCLCLFHSMTAAKLSELFASYQLSEPPERPELTNGNAYCFLRSAANKKTKYANARDAIIQHFKGWNLNSKVLHQGLRDLDGKVTGYKQNAHRPDKWNELCTFLTKPFNLKTDSSHPSSTPDSSPTSSASPQPEPSSTPESSASPQPEPSSTPESSASPQPGPSSTSNPSTPLPSKKRLRSDCESCQRNRGLAAKISEKRREEAKLVRAARRISIENVVLNSRNQTLSSKIVNAKQKTQDVIKEKKKVQRRERILLRKKVLTETEKDSLITAQRQDISKLKAQLRYWKNKHIKNSELCDCHVDIIDLQIKNDSLTSKIKNLTEVIEDLEVQIKDSADQLLDLETKDGISYTADIRKCIFRLLEANTPVTECGDVIDFIVKTLTNYRLTDVPKKTTVSNCGYEMGIISSIHMINFVKKQDKLCLSWDATGLKGNHINEVHITANATQHMYVDVNVVAGGRAEDYVDQIMSAFSSAASVFSKFSGEPEGDVLAGIYKTLVASLTDRAVVNHKTKIDLEEAVNSQLDGLNLLLSEYNCNLHPLDSIASAVRKALTVIYPPVLI